jgi:hypothetical protein
MEIKDKAKSFGSTVKKNIENADSIIDILRTIAIAKFNERNNVFKRIMMIKRNDMPFKLLNHDLNNLPRRMRGIKLINNINKGTISLNIKAFIV